MINLLNLLKEKQMKNLVTISKKFVQRKREYFENYKDYLKKLKEYVKEILNNEKAKVLVFGSIVNPFQLHLITPEEFEGWYKNFIKNEYI